MTSALYAAVGSVAINDTARERAINEIVAAFFAVQVSGASGAAPAHRSASTRRSIAPSCRAASSSAPARRHGAACGIRSATSCRGGRADLNPPTSCNRRDQPNGCPACAVAGTSSSWRRIRRCTTAHENERQQNREMICHVASYDAQLGKYLPMHDYTHTIHSVNRLNRSTYHHDVVRLHQEN